MATYFPIRGPWVVEFTRGEKLSMGIIRKQDFGILASTMAVLQRNWDLEWENCGKLYRENIVRKQQLY